MLNSIVVIVKGGVVQSVYGDLDCNVEVVDYDEILEDGVSLPSEDEVVEGLKQLW